MAILSRDEDTICAVATPPGKGGIAVLRVSGKDSYGAVCEICSFLPKIPESHKVFYGFLENNGDRVDEVLVTYFQANRSFTGEPTVEISCHGNPTITKEIIEILNRRNVRLAQPGEFTYRAFMSGRIDLVQAEGVLSLIESESQRASRMSLRQLTGGQSKELVEIEDSLTLVLAHCEANIDFASEDIEISSNIQLQENLSPVLKKIEKILGNYQAGKTFSDGIQIALLGQPNVGKSSLLNALLGEEKAIVTDIPGTTRDIVEGEIWSSGIKLKLFDTAGLRRSDDIVENVGIKKAKEIMGKVDFSLVLLDPVQEVDFSDIEITSEYMAYLVTKSDLHKMDHGQCKKFTDSVKEKFNLPEAPIFTVSSKTGDGLGEIIPHILGLFEHKVSEGQDPIVYQARHVELLTEARGKILDSLGLLKKNESPDIVSFELQRALQAIQEILGKMFDDEVMDRVFKEFCLGK